MPRFYPVHFECYGCVIRVLVGATRCRVLDLSPNQVTNESITNFTEIIVLRLVSGVMLEPYDGYVQAIEHLDPTTIDLGYCW